MKNKILFFNKSVNKSAKVTENVIIIKKFIEPKICRRIVKFLNKFKKKHSENELVSNGNWHYTVNSNKNFFYSFHFYNLKSLKNLDLIKVYKKIYNLYKRFNNTTFTKNFEKEIVNPIIDSKKRIVPLVFYYPADKSNFVWHKHPGSVQPFQIVVNLTEPGIDYLGGETLILIKKKISKEIIKNKNNIISITPEKFSIGDLYSFPGNAWHMIKPTKSTINIGNNARISLIMPLALRKEKKKIKTIFYK